jgi:hypothetical protein
VVPPPKNSLRRDDGEMAFLIATSAAFGITTGAWIDTLSLCSPNNKKKNADGTTFIDPKTGGPVNECDPAGAIVSPLLFGTLFPLGFFLWDNFYKGGIHRGVPSSISTGMIIGALEGLGVAGANFAIAGDTSGNRWGSDGIMTSVWIGTALGGIGGYAFGEAIRPDPRKIALIASGAGWGALMGSTFGGGVSNSDGNSVAQGMLVGNLVGINVGVITTGILAAVGYDPSWQSLKYMWLGAGIGLLGTSALIYPIYLATGQKDKQGPPVCGTTADPGCSLVNHGMVANSFGMLAGVVIAGILTRDLKDPEPVPPPPETTAPPPPGSPNGPPPPPGMTGPTTKREKTWRPPFMFSVSPTQNGGMVGISGQW